MLQVRWLYITVYNGLVRFTFGEHLSSRPPLINSSKYVVGYASLTAK